MLPGGGVTATIIDKRAPDGVNGDEEGTQDQTDAVTANLTGFEMGWEAEDILGATEARNQILFLVKWYVDISVCVHVSLCSSLPLPPSFLSLPPSVLGRDKVNPALSSAQKPMSIFLNS